MTARKILSYSIATKLLIYIPVASGFTRTENNEKTVKYAPNKYKFYYYKYKLFTEIANL